MTSSLFATTVAASFFVVALPHILPCPAPRVTYADSATGPDGTRRRRRRKPEEQAVVVHDGIVQFESTTEDFDRVAAQTGRTSPADAAAAATRARKERECPVPKPGGVIGELMGFKKSETTDGVNSEPRDKT